MVVSSASMTVTVVLPLLWLVLVTVPNSKLSVVVVDVGTPLLGVVNPSQPRMVS